jgi:hypothetical protein
MLARPSDHFQRLPAGRENRQRPRVHKPRLYGLGHSKCALLERQHGQDQGVERQVVKALANQLSGGKWTRGALGASASKSVTNTGRCFLDIRTGKTNGRG